MRFEDGVIFEGDVTLVNPTTTPVPIEPGRDCDTDMRF